MALRRAGVAALAPRGALARRVVHQSVVKRRDTERILGVQILELTAELPPLT